MKRFFQIIVLLSVTCSVYGQLQMSVKKTDNTTVNILLNDITDITFGSSIPMVQVTGGTFQMGAPDQTNPHSVTLTSYYISQTEVTQGQWQAVMGSNPSSFTGVGSTGPVERVTWYNCISFCNKLSINERKTPCYSIGGNTAPADWTVGTIVCDFNANGYRLPTEAEWEYAAKGGNLMQNPPYTYSGSNTIDNVAWYTTNSGNTTHTVGGKQANELGLYDMSGNVFEWCWDWYGSYTSNAQTDPTGPSTGTYRLLRGGSWYLNFYFCAVSERYDVYARNYYNYIGLRLSRR